MYIIASLKHTNKHNEHITFWGPDYCGYVLIIKDGHVGEYSADFVTKDGVLNNGVDCIAVPSEAVKALLSPQPYYACGGTAARFYDTPGPVVNNTRANWNRLIAASMPRQSTVKVKPEVFRGTRRSFSIEALEGSPT
jgi:hypothetical protein